jgi:tRNA(His) 5'-end guanylyltransferase
MKNNYEDVSRFYLTRRTPVVGRIDGKAFHTLTKGMKRPFDDRLVKCMYETAKRLVEEVQGCKVAYVQSDEISLLLTDFDTLETSAWFDYNLQKMTSVAASIATAAFNQYFVHEFAGDEHHRGKVGLFDARFFNIPKEEVCNYFIWRQKDAIRNSISSVAQAHFSAKQLHGLNQSQVKELLLNQVNINWEDLPDQNKYGYTIVRSYAGRGPQTGTPVFTENRNVIDQFLTIGEQ